MKATIAVSLLVFSIYIYIARCAPPWLDLDTEPCRMQYGYLVVSIYWSHWTHATSSNVLSFSLLHALSLLEDSQVRPMGLMLQLEIVYLQLARLVQKEGQGSTVH